MAAGTRAMITFLLVVATTSGAHAGACPQLRDGTGDVREYRPYVGIPNDQLDVVSGDTMGNRDVVAMQAGVVALAKLDPISPTGRGYTIIADIGDPLQSHSPEVALVPSHVARGRNLT